MRKLLAIAYLVTAVGCGHTQPSVDLLQTRVSPSNHLVAHVERLSYDSTVPFVYEVRVGRTEFATSDRSGVVARMIDPERVNVRWISDNAIRIEAIGGRLDRIAESYCPTQHDDAECVEVRLLPRYGLQDR